MGQGPGVAAPFNIDPACPRVAKANNKVWSWLTTVNASGRSVPFLVQSAKKSGTEFEQKSPRQLGKFSPSFERTIFPPTIQGVTEAIIRSNQEY